MGIIQITGKTDTGQRRKDNQDSYICRKLWGTGDALLAVIDGVGGYAGGDIAAAIAREAMAHYMQTPKGGPLTMLREAVVFANNQVAEERAENPRYSQMCCVLTAAVADAAQQKLYFAHVGDTRLYRFAAGKLEKLTSDHSLVGMREDAGELSEAEAMAHPRRNEILREVGSTIRRIDDPKFLEYGQTHFAPADQLLLCSDGLTDMVTQAQIIGVLEKKVSLEKKAAELIALANEMGGHDNITVVLAQNNSTAKAIPIPKNMAGSKETPPIVPDPVISKGLPEKPKPAKKKNNLYAVVVGLILLCCLGWLMLRPVKKPPTANPMAAINDSTIQLDSLPNSALPTIPDSLLANAKKSTTRVLQLNPPTGNLSLGLDSTIGLTGIKTVAGGDSIYKQTTIQTNKPGKGTAFEIEAGSFSAKDTVRLKNLVLKDFETGIRIKGNAILLLENLRFEGVAHPVSYHPGLDSSGKTRVIWVEKN